MMKLVSCFRNPQSTSANVLLCLCTFLLDTRCVHFTFLTLVMTSVCVRAHWPGMCVPLYLMCISCRPASVGEYCTVTVPSRLSEISGWADLPEGIRTSPERESETDKLWAVPLLMNLWQTRCWKTVSTTHFKSFKKTRLPCFCPISTAEIRVQL